MRPKQAIARIAVVASAGLLAGCSDDADRGVIGSDTSSQGSDQESEGKASESESTAEDFVVESGFTTSVDSINTRYTSAGARLTNPNPELAAYDVQVLFNLLADNGDVLDSQTETISYVPPSTSVPVAPLQIGFDLKTEPTDLDVQVVGEFSRDEGPRGQLGGEGAILEFEGAEVLQGDYGPELSARVTNSTDSVAEFASWACIYVDGNAILGGSSSAIIDPIPPGSTVEFGESLSVRMTPKSVECWIVTDL